MKNKITLLLLVLITLGCGARHVEKEVIHEQQKTEEKINDSINIQTDIQTKSIDSSSTTEMDIEPVDSSKPMLVNGKEYKNVRFKTRKIQNHIQILSEDKSSLNELKISEKATTTNIDKSTKDIDKESSFSIPWYWWLILIGLFLGYIEYKK